MKKIYLVDVSSLFFRAFYAVHPLTSPSGLPVNAIYGFLSMLIKLLKQEKPEYMVFCYDRKEPSFRKDMYAEYKANRTEMPEDLAKQIPYIKKLADLLGIASLEVPQYEADDLIGTLTQFGRSHNMEVVIVSGDKDFGQLIEDGVVLYDTMKNVRYDVAGVFTKWGIRPDQFIDFLAIVGDTSDNIPGVRGIGEKGAIKLLEQFKDLESIYAGIEEISSKSIKQKLIDAKENAFLSKKLVKIVTDVPLQDDVESLRLKPYKTEELRALLAELNFKTFENSLFAPPAETPEVPAADISTAQQVVHKVSPPETPAKKTSKKSSGSASEQASFAMTFNEDDSVGIEELKKRLIPESTVYGCFDERCISLWINGELLIYSGDRTQLGPLTDLHQISWQGFDLKSLWYEICAQTPKVDWDSQLAAYLLKAGDSSDFAKIYEREVGEALGEAATHLDLMTAHLRLRDILQNKIKQQDQEKIYRQLDLPLSPILLAMERKGIQIDSALLAKQSTALEKDVQTLEKQIHEIAGEEFNVGSPKQLGKILFEKLGLTATKKTKTGYSTDNDVLEKIENPIAALVLQYRELSKLKSTYVDALPELADEQGRVHTSFNQALTATGRLSSTKPNLQNIPIRTPRGQEVRKAFVAAEGKKLLSMDYSQIELRVLAHISEDPNMSKAFAEDLDIHAATAAEIFSTDLKSVTSEMRRVAKAVNFGIAYGQGAFGLAEVLGIPRSESQDIIKRYFERFKNIKSYIENTIVMAHEKGYVETLSGRRRYIEELSAKNPALKKFGERAAINAPIQGTAADLVKKAMIEIANQIPVPMVLQVHDELIFEEKEEVLKEYLPKLKSIMEGVADLRVPLKVNYAIGSNWDEAH